MSNTGREKITKAGPELSDDAGMEMNEMQLPNDERSVSLIQQILSDLQMMSKLARRRARELHNADEWAFISLVVDRLFFWLFALSNALALLVIFVIYPSVSKPTIGK